MTARYKDIQDKKVDIIVVYFNQQTHACAWVRMVENDQKYLKMSKKVFSVDFNHANACASMRSLVEIHNNCEPNPAVVA